MKIATSPCAPKVACLTAIFCLFSISDTFAQQTVVKGANHLQAHFLGRTKPLRELTPQPATPHSKQQQKKRNKPYTPPNFINYHRPAQVNPDALPIGEDPIRQDAVYQHRNIPVLPNLVFEGIGEDVAQVGVPDTNGDVGPEHYVQIVNASWFQVFAKDGTPLSAPISANTIWSEINRTSLSDPVILYDEGADRWLLTDLTEINVVLYGISETSDPLGPWNVYEFATPGFADYPKYGVWPAAYIFTVNNLGGDYPVYALNRAQLLNGMPVIDIITIDIPGFGGFPGGNSGFPAATPMDWNGQLAPPEFNHCSVVRLKDDGWDNGGSQDLLEVWDIELDWLNPGNTTATLVPLATAPYDSDACSIPGGSFSFECIPQPGTLQGIDGIMTIVMNKVVYRNFGAYESAVLTFSVDATGNNVSGIRWMEIRRTPGSDWTIFQESTFAPNDGVNRFIGSVAVNGRGDIGLAYSVSGDTQFPSLRFTGRSAYDPSDVMTVDEYEFATGEGVRSSDRYGDYANMTVDPVDGSFWFTGEYVLADGNFGTKIVNFTLGRDTIDLAPTMLLAPANADDLTDQESVTVQVRNVGLEPVSGFAIGYIFENGTPVVEPASIDTLKVDSTYTHTFGPKVDMSAIRSYNFTAFTSFADDQNVRNDTLRLVRRKLPRFDAAITGVLGLNNALCDSTATVQALLSNFGTLPLNSASVSYRLNGGALKNTSWTGNLATGNVDTISLVLAGLSSGANTLELFSSGPNGQMDEDPANDTLNRPFQTIINGRQITLHLSFDYYSEETSWTLQDQNGNTLFAGDNYDDYVEDSIDIDWCLAEEQCYVFTIYDEYGDGVYGGGFGKNGDYTIEDENGNILASLMDPDFGFQESNTFCVGKKCNTAATIDVTSATGANTPDGAILVNVTAGAGPFEYSIDSGSTYQMMPLFSNLLPGDYVVAIKDGTGCLIYQNVTVNVMVSAESPADLQSVTVSPNPSSDGVFFVKAQDFKTQGKPLAVQVFDASGRTVVRQVLPFMDGCHQGLLSIAGQPSGVYYLLLKSDTKRQLVKIIRN